MGAEHFLAHDDAVTIPLETPITRDMNVTIRHSQPVRILLAGGEINLPVAAENVGKRWHMRASRCRTWITANRLKMNHPSRPHDTVVRVSEEIKMQPTAILTPQKMWR